MKATPVLAVLALVAWPCTRPCAQADYAADMSSQKTTIELPSRLFQLYVSGHSNRGRYNEGKGLEGIGVIPHELEYAPADLDQKIDTLLARAEALLARFPQKSVRYDPKEFGWKR